MSEVDGAPRLGEVAGGSVVPGDEVDEYGGDSRPPVYWDPEVGLWVYRAYALGNCVKALTAFRQGVTPADHPDWLLRAFREGHENESVILNMLYDPERMYPWAPVEGMRQVLMEIPVGSKALIRGHNDDVAVVKARPTVSGPPEGEQRLVEVKAFADSTYKTWRRYGWGAFPYYAVQISCYMEMFGMPGLFVIGVKDADTRVVTKLEVFPVDKPPVPMAQIKAKVFRIENSEGLPGCDFKQYPCQMYFLGDENGCGGEGSQHWRPTKLPTEEERELEKQLRDSVALEGLNFAAESIFEGTRMRNQGSYMIQNGEIELRNWQTENPELVEGADGEGGKVQKYQTSKWNVTVHPVGGIAVRPRRENP